MDTTKARNKMSAEVESGLFVERPAWHGLGLVVDRDHGFTTTELTAKAFPGVDGKPWTVETTPIVAHRSNGTTVPVDGQIAVVRSIDPAIVGIHGDNYVARNPLDNALLLDSALHGADWESMISLRDGRRTVFLARLGDGFQVGGVDAVKLYAMLADSYDGSLALTVGTTAVRVVCQNTLAMAMPEIEARPHYKVKHTKNSVTKVEDVRNAMELALVWADGFQAKAEELINTEVSKGRFEEIIRECFPKVKSDPAPFSREQYSIFGVLENSPTIDEGIKRTGWGAINAVTEFLEWGRSRRSSGDGDPEAAQRAMAERRLEDAMLSDQVVVGKVAEMVLSR